MKIIRLASLAFAASLAAFAAAAHAQTVLTTHRLPAALASEAAAAAVESCARQGYKVTAAVIDADGVTQATLRGDGASMTALGAAGDKAYTAFMLGAPRHEDSSGAVAKRIGANAAAGGPSRARRCLRARGTEFKFTAIDRRQRRVDLF